MSEYGRMAEIASWAFFNFEAETIFMADVICIVDETDAILFRISFKLAIVIYSNWAEILLATAFNVSKTSSVSFPDLMVSNVSRCLAFNSSK